MSEFELKSLITALELLKNGNYITEEQRQSLFEYYKTDKRKYSLIHDEIRNLRFDKELLNSRLIMSKKNKKIQASVIEEKPVILGTKVDIKEFNNEKKEVELSLDNITDFEKDGKDFIKIHYLNPDEKIKVIENRTDPYISGKEIFEELKDTYGDINLNGIDNAALIFEEVLLKKCIETKLQDEEELSKREEFAKLSLEEQKKFYGLKLIMASNKDEFKDKKVYVCLEEEIVIISTPDELDKDKTRKLIYDEKEGKYKLIPVKEKGYKNDSDVIQSDKTEYNEEKENEEYEIQNIEDLDKEIKGPAFVKRKKDKRNSCAAFISVLWVVVFCGILVGMGLVALFDLLYK